MSRPAPRIGVLALQGDVRDHARIVERLGATAISVRRREELAAVDGLILPGGESTTVCRLLDVFELREPITERLRAGMPAYGSCAGMITLARSILDGRPDQRPLGALEITVRRNAFGRQVDSFETLLSIRGVSGEPMRAVFIRAPWVEQAGPDVEVLADIGAPTTAVFASNDQTTALLGDAEQPSKRRRYPVAVRSDAVIATSFHPEMTDDDRIHRMFVEMVSDVAAGSDHVR